MDRLEAMHTFVRVAEKGSFSAVAEQRDVARSVITRQIAALESHLGTKLIARSTRRLSLTVAGMEYLEKCREILNLVDEAETSVSNQRLAARGPIRVSVPLTLGLRYLMPLMTDFARENPEITFEVDFSDRRVNLIQDGMDLSIRVSSHLDPNEVARKISSCRLAVVASPNYLEKNGTPAHPAELERHQCFGYVVANRSRWSFMVEGQEQWYPIQGWLQANNGEALLDAAVRGGGITRAPTFLVAPALKRGEVCEILSGFPSPDLGIYAIFPSGRYVPQRIRALVDYLSERIGHPPFWERGGSSP